MSAAPAPTEPTVAALLKAGIAHQHGGRLAEAGAGAATGITHVVARAGYPVHLVPGEPDNLKLIYPKGWDAAQARLAEE